MQIKSNVITAVVTALSVVALTWNPAADAAAPQSNSISVCVNKKGGSMRNASICKNSERLISVAGANSVQTVISHVTVPNFFGRDAETPIDGPMCTESAPIYISGAGYSTNYTLNRRGEFKNSDGSPAGYVNGRNVTFDPTEGGYPKDGDMDLYLVSLCAPILVVQ